MNFAFSIVEYIFPSDKQCRVTQPMNQSRISAKAPVVTALLAALVLTCILQRGSLILFGYSHISHPYVDEPVSGTLTRDLLDGGLRAPLFLYQYENRSGDVLIEGLLMYPLYRLFGPSMCSIKLFAMLSTLASMIAWIAFFRRYCGAAAALTFAALFALPPPMVARLNLVGTLSSHHMLNVLVPLQALLLFRALEQGRDRISAPTWLGLGLMAGLGTYTFYSYIIFNAFCALFVLLFRRPLLRRKSLLLFFAGAAAGLSPWVYRSLQSTGGAMYLRDLLKGVSVSLWPLLQSFGFNVAHSFGYGYPGREIGAAGVAFTLFLLVCLIVVATTFRANRRSHPAQDRAGLPVGTHAGVFVGFFPVFFLICLSFSPKQVDPLEYWPHFGLYATFAPSDFIRYRWMHILYPFYFGLAGIALALVLRTQRRSAWMKTAFICVVAFFLLFNGWKGLMLCSRADFGKLGWYKGYSYDLMATRFILPDFSSLGIEDCERLAREYPAENRLIAHRHLGTRVFLELLKKPDMIQSLSAWLDRVPPEHVPDVLYGIASTMHFIPAHDSRSVTEFLSKRFPGTFHEIWGYRFLADTYYGYLLNREVLFEHIPPVEQFFFKPFFKDLHRRIEESLPRNCPGPDTVDPVARCLLHDIAAVEPRYQCDVAKGIGRLIGVEMLLDPLHQPDYPLSDQIIVTVLAPALHEALYTGIGAGLAQALCRHWRRLMPPDAIHDPAHYEKLLDVEWRRCAGLREEMHGVHKPAIEGGFTEELRRIRLSPPIRAFLSDRL